MSNSSNSGWVRLWRKIEDNEIWLSEPFTKAQAWIDLFLNANHKDNSIFIRGNEIQIKRGQIGWSELTMSKRWRWSKMKVRRHLKWLETRQQIKQQKSTITTVLTIISYDAYQPETIQQTRQQKDSRRDTNNNVKNDKTTPGEEKQSYKTTDINYLLHIPLSDYPYLQEGSSATAQQIKNKAKALYDYLRGTGRTMKDYRFYLHSRLLAEFIPSTLDIAAGYILRKKYEKSH